MERWYGCSWECVVDRKMHRKYPYAGLVVKPGLVPNHRGSFSLLYVAKLIRAHFFKNLSLVCWRPGKIKIKMAYVFYFWVGSEMATNMEIECMRKRKKFHFWRHFYIWTHLQNKKHTPFFSALHTTTRHFSILRQSPYHVPHRINRQT